MFLFMTLAFTMRTPPRPAVRFPQHITLDMFWNQTKIGFVSLVPGSALSGKNSKSKVAAFSRRPPQNFVPRLSYSGSRGSQYHILWKCCDFGAKCNTSNCHTDCAVCESEYH